MKRYQLFKGFLALATGALIVTGPSIRAADSGEGATLFAALTKANDQIIGESLDRPGGQQRGGFGGTRGWGAAIMTYAAAYASPGSKYYHDDKLIAGMDGLITTLKNDQLPDGLFGDSGNLDSPPDTSFMLKTICKGQLFLIRDGSEKTAALRDRLKDLILTTAEGVRTGGIHTPNHRWAVCTSLAHVNELYPDKKWVDRIDDWLGEGIDVDADGQWAERSPNYTSDVDNPAITDVAIILKRPELLKYIRKNLEMTVYHMDANGEVENVASRRQDQKEGSHKFIYDYYYPYRYLAIHDNNPTFAAMARYIETTFLKELGDMSTNMSSAVTCMLEYPEMAKDLPEGGTLPDSYAKEFPLTAMERIRRGSTSATIYGGSDWFMGLGFGSGIATNPTFFKMHKGKAILESVRMTPAFFSTGFFYSQGLKVADGKYVLSQVLNVPYHQPLPKADRNPAGNYKLSPDMGAEGLNGRYFAKMDFADRPSQFRTLKSVVTVTEDNGAFNLEFNVDGYPGIPVTIELGFVGGGKFTGVEPMQAAGGGGRGGRGGAGGRGGRGGGEGGAATALRGGPLPTDQAAGSYVLKEGTGTYTVGDDTITFGPGQLARPPGRMENEDYSWVNGSLRAEGDHVYITGVTPMKYTLTLK